ncbi:MAG: AAA family ATPase [bacterium]|nr:AAA family ATPase [bacterium]
MYLKSIELSGFKSFAKKSVLEFRSPIAAIVGPNGSGKSNVAEAFRFVLGEQSMKSMRGKRGPDLIWSGNERTSRANRARIAVTFDNRPGRSGKPLFDIDFDEVLIERTVYRDGTNEYVVNGSKVRLKDVGALLASANIGASGHHIISQGEADRILGASPKERREMVEDALGLKAYQFKKAESERKLEKTNENMKEVKSLQREIAPHLKFLEHQMQKLERARELKTELAARYREYLANERARLNEEKKRITACEEEPRREFEEVARAIAKAKEKIAPPAEHTTEGGALAQTEGKIELENIHREIKTLQEKKGELERSLGRLEAMIEVQTGARGADFAAPRVSAEETGAMLREIDALLGGASSANDSGALLALVQNVRERVGAFLKKIEGLAEAPADDGAEATRLHEEKTRAEAAIEELAHNENTLAEKRSELLKRMDEARAEERLAERSMFELQEKENSLTRTLDSIARDKDALAHDIERLEDVEKEARDVLGEDTGGGEVEAAVLGGDPKNRREQEEALRAIERLRVRFEEADTVDTETITEYKETKERTEFLTRELDDLEKTQESLVGVIETLEHELETRFKDGLQKIHEEFKKFFSVLFDGGDAQLTLIKKERKKSEDTEEGAADGEEEVAEKEGIDIEVKLPRKKVATLDILSGGERALTSIALIFAMSQVNPPPFIVLDETDAALDEANSRKYAEMVRTLSEHSQLILITHNRRTMEAAGELYGITMGSDGISKLLSVKIEEAVRVAK